MKLHVLAAIALLGLTACGEEELGTASAPESLPETAEIVAVEPVAEADLGRAFAENTSTPSAVQQIDRTLEGSSEALEEAGNTITEAARDTSEEISEAAENTAEAVEDTFENVTSDVAADAEDGQAAIEEVVAPAA